MNKLSYTRRDFLKTASFGAAALALPVGLFTAETNVDKPNILWILSEDISPDLGCYGTRAVRTPNLDSLASQGVRYTNAFTTSPVCSASRSAMITGMYQTSIGVHNHRSHRGDGYTLPEPVRLITAYLREAGYFTANVTTAAPGFEGSGKTDFNFQHKDAFDGSDWNQRKPGQPFFAQLSIMETHRGEHWKNLGEMLKDRVDPALIDLPPYYPDHPVAREDWATYLDSIQLMDQYVGKVMKRLDAEGLSDNTVVIFIGDHGRCHVRGKQWLYDGGIHIPLIIRWPGKLEAGEVCDDLVSAIDISATVLKIAGIDPPTHMEGQVFLGPEARKREYIIAARDRCDETIDRIRCVRTKRYKYIRNFMPDRPYTQKNAYKLRSYPMLSLMENLHAQDKLTTTQALFMAPRKPDEELYDIWNDPYEINNLSASPEHQQTMKRMRIILEKWIRDTGDQGQFPEKESAILERDLNRIRENRKDRLDK
ncbi:MAG: sulfatase [Fidelibacterota bacterium]|nr:MAG: sulfatase [Candidatus Neomarinimicrobiota bacterium]